MELIIKKGSVPIKAIPQDELNKMILTEFMPWVSRLLGLMDEKAADRLEIALPAIKEHCWSMGFEQIQKMFTLYADGKLSLQPKTNYFDRILLGQIVQSYKASLPTPKNVRIEAPQISQDEKNKLLENGVLECYQHFLEYGNIKEGKAWVYGYLVEQGKINDTPEFKRECMVKAKANLINDSKDIKKLDDRKSFVAKLEGKKNGQVITEAKRISLIQHFQNQ